MSVLPNQAQIILTVIRFAAEYFLVIYFFLPLKNHPQKSRQAVGAIVLALIGFLYFQRFNSWEQSKIDPAHNFGVQILRLVYYLLIVWAYLFLSKKKTWAQICYLGLYYIFFYSTSRIYQILISIVTRQISWTEPYFTSWTFMLSFLLLTFEYSIAYMVHRLVPLDMIRKISRAQIVLAVSVNLLSVYFRYAMMAQQNTPNHQDIAASVLFPLFTGIAFELFLVFFESWQAAEGERKQLAVQKAMRTYELKHITRSAENSQHIRQIYHDMKNHLLAIRSMEDDSTGVVAYIDSILGKMEPYEEQIRTGISFMDAYLSEKAGRFKETHIRYNIALDLTPLVFMDPVDLISIIGNSIDNAMDALLKVPEEERLLSVKSTRFANTILLHFTNTFNGELDWNSDLPATLKRDKENHGIGLRSIQKAAALYGGSVTIAPEQGKKQFRLTIMIPMGEA